MSLTIEECLEHARQCEWYAARTNDEGDRKFLLWRAQQWTKLAQEKELFPSGRPHTLTVSVVRYASMCLSTKTARSGSFDLASTRNASMQVPSRSIVIALILAVAPVLL